MVGFSLLYQMPANSIFLRRNLCQQIICELYNASSGSFDMGNSIFKPYYCQTSANITIQPQVSQLGMPYHSRVHICSSYLYPEKKEYHLIFLGSSLITVHTGQMLNFEERKIATPSMLSNSERCEQGCLGNQDALCSFDHHKYLGCLNQVAASVVYAIYIYKLYITDGSSRKQASLASL